MEINCSQQCMSGAALSVRLEVVGREAEFRTGLPQNNRAVQTSSGCKMSELGTAFEKNAFAAQTLFLGTCKL